MTQAHSPITIDSATELAEELKRISSAKTIKLGLSSSGDIFLATPQSELHIKDFLGKERNLIRFLLAPHRTVVVENGKEIYKRYLHPNRIKLRQLFDLDLVPRLVPEISTARASWCDRVTEAFSILKSQGMEKVAALEFRLLPVAAEMEINGCGLDVPGLRLKVADWQQAIEEIVSQMAPYISLPAPQLGLFGNLSGPDISQLYNATYLDAVFKKNGIELPNYSEDALRACNHSLANLVLQFRHFDKLVSYAMGLLQYADSQNRVHPTFDQLGTETGRFTCRDPNIQQVPQELRSVMVAPPGSVLITADYSQIELRILAELSGDKGFADIFARGGDLHSITAAEMFGVPIAEVTPKLRTAAKAINFGLVYGRGPASLGKQLGISPDSAAELINRYFNRYRGIKEYLEGASQSVLEKGYTTTLLGRRRHFRVPDKRDPEYIAAVRRIERQAKNSPVQGTSADIIKLALINVHYSVEKWYGKIVNTVHDEIVVEAPKDREKEISLMVQKAMEDAGRELLKSTPVKVEVSAGSCWGK